MKILQIIDSLDPGGAEKFSVNLANTLAERQGYSSFLLVTNGRGKLRSLLNPSTRVEFLEKEKKNIFKSVLHSIRIIYEIKPALIHAHSSSIYLALILKLIFRDIRLVYHDHNPKIVPRNLLFRLSRYIDYTITVNEEIQAYHLKYSSCKIVQLLNNFSAVNDSCASSSKKQDELEILMVANFRKEKNHDLLIESINDLCQNGYQLQLTLVGSNTNSKVYEDMIALIAKYELGSRISIYNDIIDVSSFLRKADICVLSSSFEGTPLALIEYGLSGTPCVVTDVGENSKIVRDFTDGRVVEAGNAEIFASAIQNVIDNLPFYQSNMDNFKERVNNEYGPNKFIKDYLELLS